MCRFVGIAGNYSVAPHIATSLMAENYAAHESAGIAVGNSGCFKCIAKAGTVIGVFNQGELNNISHGEYGIGHVACNNGSLQPEIFTVGESEVACCADATYETYNKIKTMLQSHNNVERAVKEALLEIKEPFAMLTARPDGSLIAARSNGRMPVAFGKINDGDMKGHYVSSQRGVLGQTAHFIHSLFVGEMVIIRKDDYRRIAVNPTPDITRCLQELIFWQRPDNIAAGREIHTTRIMIGKALGRKFQKKVTLPSLKNVVAIAIPDGGLSYLNGFGQETGIKIDPGAVIKSRYPVSVSIKTPKGVENPGYSIIEEVVRGKVVIIVDDAAKTFSRIRAMTKKAYEYGAKEVHAVLATVITRDCPYGKDIAMGKYVFDLESSGLSSLTTLTTSEMKAAINTPHRIYCFDCQL